MSSPITRCANAKHKAGGAALRLSCEACCKALAGVFASADAFFLVAANLLDSKRHRNLRCAKRYHHNCQEVANNRHFTHDIDNHRSLRSTKQNVSSLDSTTGWLLTQHMCCRRCRSEGLDRQVGRVPEPLQQHRTPVAPHGPFLC